MKNTLLILAISLAISACGTKELPKELSLKKEYKDSFLIGAALNKDQILGNEEDTLKLVAKQFNSYTAENEMKWEAIHPTKDTYHFESADALVELAKQNDSFLVGHTLVWHAQTPDWVFENANGELVSKATLTDTVTSHINTVAGRYKNAVQGWDVLNEALNEDGTLRDSKWRQILGDDYIEQVFALAQKAAPNSELYYNDYNLYKPEKRAGVVRLVNNLQNKGIKIDGVGIQGHYALDYPDLAELEQSIIEFSALGLKVMITELDVSVLPFPEDAVQGADISINIELQSKYDPYRKGITDSANNELASRYIEIFKLFNKHQEKISRVTFWGVHDGQSWRNYWPMQGRSDYPLLIDREKKLKPFVKELVEQTK